MDLDNIYEKAHAPRKRGRKILDTLVQAKKQGSSPANKALEKSIRRKMEPSNRDLLGRKRGE